MEIMKETPWSRIQGQNSVYKEFLEIVGNGKPTGSVLEETIAVSATILLSVEKWHSRIRLRILSCSRMSENHRGTRSPREKSHSGRMFRWPCKDYFKGTCTNSFCENGILQYACSTSQRMDADLEKSALMRTARLKNSLARGLKRMVTKVQSLCCKGMNITIEQGDLFRTLTHQVHDNWVAYFRIWSRRSLHRFCGRTQT